MKVNYILRAFQGLFVIAFLSGCVAKDKPLRDKSDHPSKKEESPVEMSSGKAETLALFISKIYGRVKEYDDSSCTESCQENLGFRSLQAIDGVMEIDFVIKSSDMEMSFEGKVQDFEDRVELIEGNAEIRNVDPKESELLVSLSVESKIEVKECEINSSEIEINWGEESGPAQFQGNKLVDLNSKDFFSLSLCPEENE